MSGNLKCPTSTEVVAAMTHMVGEVSAKRIWKEALKATQVVESAEPPHHELRTVLHYIVTTKGLAGLAARSQLIRLDTFLTRKSA